MNLNSQAQFQLVLKRLEKAKEEIQKSHTAFQEIEKINFMIEIMKEQFPKAAITGTTSNAETKGGDR